MLDGVVFYIAYECLPMDHAYSQGIYQGQCIDSPADYLRCFITGTLCTNSQKQGRISVDQNESYAYDYWIVVAINPTQR